MLNRNLSSISTSSYLNLNDPAVIRAYVPSIFAEGAAEKTSSKYIQIPTIRVVEAMWSAGWKIAKVQQTRSADREHTKHMIRFRHPEAKLIVGQNIPEICLLNSHDGSSSYQLRAGIYRVVCSNGLITGSDTFLHRIRHSGRDIPEKVAQSAHELLTGLPEVEGKIIELTAQTLSNNARKVFAVKAIDLRESTQLTPEERQEALMGIDRTGEYRGHNIERLLLPRRSEDREPTAWNSLNVLQEKILKGGTFRRGENGDHRRTKTVTGVDADVRLNTGLWSLAETISALEKEGRFN